MIDAFKIAGYYAAHGIVSVTDGSTLTPMLAYATSSGERKMEYLIGADLGNAIAKGQKKLSANQMEADDAAILYDGHITIDENKTDALLIEIRNYISPSSEAIIAVPYSPKSGVFGKVHVHEPKLIVWKNCELFDKEAALKSFFDGISSHEKGAKIFSKVLDESK
jgi:hypothetical protein